jgi:hypothetical protein
MGKGGGGSSTTQQNIPKELKPLYKQSATGMMELQNQSPVSQFTGSNPLQVPGLTENQKYAGSQVGNINNRPIGEIMAFESLGKATGAADRRVTGDNLMNSPSLKAASDAFDQFTAPALSNKFKLMGLGKSSSLGNALATGKASVLQPAIEAELGREERYNRNVSDVYGSAANQYEGFGREETGRTLSSIDAGLKAGGVERESLMQDAEAQLNDYLRRQGLSEQALFAPFSQLPSTIGQTTKTSSGGGGLFK